MKRFNKNGVNYSIRVNSIHNGTKISFYVCAFRYNELPLKEFKKKLHQVLKEEFSIEGYKDFSIISEYACDWNNRLKRIYKNQFLIE